MLRSKAVGLTDDDGFDLPLTQQELADSLGITSVHMNRTMQELRSQGLIATRSKQVIINDMERLMEFSEFDPKYLHQGNGHA